MLHEQSAVNYVLDGDWLELSQSFNMLSGIWATPVRNAFEPIIVHFAGPIKPWHGAYFKAVHPMPGELERYLQSTPWKGFIASEKPRVLKGGPSEESMAFGRLRARSFDARQIRQRRSRHHDPPDAVPPATVGNLADGSHGAGEVGDFARGRTRVAIRLSTRANHVVPPFQDDFRSRPQDGGAEHRNGLSWQA